jgi:hypothetical protein
VVQKRKNPVVQNFSNYYYIRWDTIGQGKLCAVAEFFRRSRNLCHGMTHLRLKMKKTPGQFVNKMTNILVKMTDICGKAKKLASGTGFAYNDK